MKAETDEQLLQDYLSGHADRFELIVRRYGQELFHFVYRLLGSSAAAEDVLQETFLQVHLSAQSFDPQRKFRPWVFTIAANKARDVQRSQRRRPEMRLHAAAENTADEVTYADLLAGESVVPSRALETEERSSQIRKMVMQLPDHLREVLVLGYYHGFAYKEMALILGIPLGTVKSRLHAAVAMFGRMHGESEQRKSSPTVFEAPSGGEPTHGTS